MPGEQDPNRVLIFDTTLRDGEQSPGISLNTQEKLEIAQQLARLGVDVIEAGFPITSPGDFEAVQTIARTVEGPVIAGLARAFPGDIDAAWGALKDAQRPRIHTFISTSDIHIQYQMQNTREDVHGQARAAVAHAKRYCDDVEFSPMDATRSDVEFTAEVLPDRDSTRARPRSTSRTRSATRCRTSITAFLERLYELVPELRDVVLSVHCHDDLGLAVANSFAGLLAGARQVECAVNGIGERAGNAALEEIVMLIATRQDQLGLYTGAVTEGDRQDLADRLAPDRLPGAAEQGDHRPQRVRARVGHPPGRRAEGAQHATRSWTPRTIGLESNSARARQALGPPRAATGAGRARLRCLRPGAEHAFKRFKEIADKKKQVTAMDLEALLTDEIREDAGVGYSLEWFEVEASSRRAPHARVGVRGPEGEELEGAFTGDGPIDAIFHAINAATGTGARLREFRVDAVTGGQDALGEVSVVLEVDGATGSGQGVSTDILEAAGRAYVRALSNAIRRRGVAAEAEEATAQAARPAVSAP